MDEYGRQQQGQASRHIPGRRSWPTVRLVFRLFALTLFASMTYVVAHCEAAPEPLDVRVTFQGKPVAMAQVIAIGREERLRAVTDHDGKARIRLPRAGKLNCIVAFDAKLGLGGRFFSHTGEVPAAPGTVLEPPTMPIRFVSSTKHGPRTAGPASS